jgi:hypothetical protein
MSKAQFIGECQLCGRVQKLPSDVLAQHGYTVDWSMFNGVCGGSKHPPYELSSNLIETIRPNIRQQIQETIDRIAELRGRTGTTAYRRLYLNKPHAKSGAYYWEEVEFITKEGKYNRQGIRHECKDNFNTCLPLGLSLEELARDSDEKYISAVLIRRQNQLEEYLSWCDKRIVNWVKKPLISIEQS